MYPLKMRQSKTFVLILFAGIAIFSISLANPANAAAPTYVTCCIDLTTASPYRIDLSWRGAPSDQTVTGYKIEREFPVGGGFTTIVANSGSVATTYADTNLSPGATYSYRISAINSDGVGSPSTILAAITTPTPPVPVPPGRVEGLTATAVSGSEIDLTWSAPANVGGGPISGYKIEREFTVGGGFTTIVANSGSTATRYADTGVLSSRTYNYRVTAINTYGPSYDLSVPASATVPTQPAAPQGVTAVAGDGEASVSWPTQLFLGGDLTGYIINFNINGVTSSLRVASSVLSATVPGLTNGVSYSFGVSAVNKAGQGSAAVTNSVVPRANILPQAPSSSPAAVAASLTRQSLQEQINTLMATLQALTLQAKERGASLSPSAKQSAPPQFFRDLNLGAKGDDVKELKLFLINQSKGLISQKLAAIGASGYFGPLTKNALAEYQKSVGIVPASGYFGPKTRSYVNSLSGQ